MAIADEVQETGQQVLAATGAELARVLNAGIERFVGWPYRIAPGCVVDRDGTRTETFASVVYTAREGSAAPGLGVIPADTAAAVIDLSEDMDLEIFRAAYARVALAKGLKKSPAPQLKEGPSTAVTLGIIFAQRSAVPLEDLTEALQRLNAQTPSPEWPDMIVVASAGAIHYAVQFPGESLSGDWLPPAEGALDNFRPAMYVVMVIRPTAARTFKKMLAFLVAHLAIFSPGARLPNFTHILEGVPQTAITVSGYQYNLRGDLVPVPRQFYNDRYFPPLPMRIEDRKGQLLSTIQFLPWQDGGALLLRGKLPLDGLMVFLGKEALQKAGVVRRHPDLQISYVLPITSANFADMLKRLQRQSNMVVRHSEPTWTIQKVADEGSASPFVARLLMGMMRLRNIVYTDPAARDKFDKPFELVSSSLMNTRTTAREIVALWEVHSRKVASGEIARLQGRAIHIDESIDKELRKHVESFLNASVRTLKQGMQNLAAELQVNIGFLFKQQGAFENGIAALQSRGPLLADYLQQTRAWSERLVQSRNEVEHAGWVLPRVTYKNTGTGVATVEPEISGQPVTQFATFMLDRLCCFVEEFTAHCLQRLMSPEITITEIPPAKRLTEAPERFSLTLATGGLPRWKISYHASSFEGT
ncbi:MAG: hypothetical protein IT169_20210 [Bryobacterales bacterium]|nr:hypothetical protein [Bryobacterales bacterium]